jgi:integrase
MATSFDVRIWKIDVYRGSKTTTYWVLWAVAGRRFKKPHKTAALADSFRSSLVSASKKGEAFDTLTGLPVSMGNDKRDMGWYDFVCKYVDMKWPDAAATTRVSTAEALMTATMAMLKSKKGMPDDKAVRSALFRWGFNTTHRESEVMPETVRSTLEWIKRNTRTVSELEDPEVLRPVLNALARKIDGKELSAATVANRKRAVLFNALEYAVELKLLTKNPIPELKWRAPKVDHEVDPELVATLAQARTLLYHVGLVQRSGPRLKACYACSYFSALRPEEAINLAESVIKLPPQRWNEDEQQWEDDPDKWGWFNLRETKPHAGSRWTDSGEVRDKRGLKRRARKATRPVPIPPELVTILRAHLHEFGTDDQGRLFCGERGGDVPVRLYNEVWRKARLAAFTPEVLTGPLAKTPYDLRHACVSTWLALGVEGPRVAEWAGHSLEVLYKVYAKCLHGRETAALERISAGLR